MTRLSGDGERVTTKLKWRALPRDHHAYSLLYSTRGKRPGLRGLSNGVRDLVILAPGMDLPAVFQARNTKAAAAWTTAAHVYLYASEMNHPRHRLDRHAPAGSNPPYVDRGRACTILRASHDGNWNPEPLALEVFAGNHARLDLSVSDHPLADIGTVDPRPDLVLVCGIEHREFTADQQTAIKAYVDAGGVILFETPGGRGDFSRGAEAMATALFGIAARRLVDTRIVTGDGLAGSSDLSRIEYRPYAQQVFAAHETTPRLRGLVIDGQPRVLFSRADISHALLDQPCWFVAGYSPSAARALLANILHHASRLPEP